LIPTLTEYLKCQPILALNKNYVGGSGQMYQAAFKVTKIVRTYFIFVELIV